ncbi:MAG: hypothetical protein IKC32_07345 [Clostridia bacterium]|nr:hypothetical protein [Clostridia bacterium]
MNSESSAKNQAIKPRRYFAARNGYFGFSHSFEKVFAPELFDKLLILKGGPGTGKSSLMKAVMQDFLCSGTRADAIHCSSDPASLDGVIITTEQGRVGLIDGTAPHTTDPRYPGAIEEIVSLEEAFDLGMLKAQKEEIVKLSRLKADAYRAAYCCLGAAGKIYALYSALFSDYKDYYEAELDEIITLLDDSKDVKDVSELKQTTCFCKDGWVRLPYDDDDKRVYRISMDGLGEILFISLVYREAECRNIKLIAHTSPLDAGSAIELETANIRIAAAPSSKADLCLRPLPSNLPLAPLVAEHQSLLSIAASYLTKASGYHAELEAIYGKAVDFGVVDGIRDVVTAKFKTILGA